MHDTTQTGAASSDPLAGLTNFTAKELQEMKLPKPSFIVDGVLPEGTSLLAAKPKVGKTLFAQNISVAVAGGNPAFDIIPVKKGRVVFLALEGSSGGIQRRLNKMVEGKPAPENLHIVREFPKLKPDGIQRLLNIINGYPDTRLIVIDTFQRVRGKGNPQRGVYALDYEALQPLSELGMETDVSILLIHHANKMQDGDPLDFVSGSTGLTGAVDNVLVMEKDHHGQFDAQLSVIAREQESKELVFTLDRKRALWIPKGKARDFAKTPERQAIQDVLADADAPLGPKEIAKRSGQKHGNVRSLVRKMLKAGTLIQPKSGLYALPTDPP